MKYLMLFFAILSSFQSSRSDLLPEGKKKISFSFVITNIGDYPEYVFLAYPVNQSRGRPMIEFTKLEHGKATGLACRYGNPVIYAIKKDLFNPADLDISGIEDEKSQLKKLDSFFTGNNNLIPSLKITCSSLADRDAKYHYVQDEYQIQSIKTDTMIIDRGETIYKDRSGNKINSEESPLKPEGDLLPPTKKYTGYLYFALPVLAIIAVVSLVVIKKMKK
ncbi:MAG: hypothetical protein K8I03_06040 [Ignavibacteria bacterium]|nr:hypothetical protein [Ignavibacteria bacterium]